MSHEMNFNVGNAQNTSGQYTPQGEGIQKKDALDMLDAADLDGFGGLSREELTKHQGNLEGQLQMLNMVKHYFGGGANPMLDFMANSLEQQLGTASFLSEHFDEIARQDHVSTLRGGPDRPVGDFLKQRPKDTISATDLEKIAAKDGNVEDISVADVTPKWTVVPKEPVPPSEGKSFTPKEVKKFMTKIGLFKTQDPKKQREIINEYVGSPVTKKNPKKDMDLAMFVYDYLGNMATAHGNPKVLTPADVDAVAKWDKDAKTVGQSDIDAGKRKDPFAKNFDTKDVVAFADRVGLLKTGDIEKQREIINEYVFSKKTPENPKDDMSIAMFIYDYLELIGSTQGKKRMTEKDLKEFAKLDGDKSDIATSDLEVAKERREILEGVKAAIKKRNS